MKKKLFSILLSLVMVVSMMPAMTLTASAEDMATITVDLSGGTLQSGAPAGWTDNGNGTYSKEFPKNQDANFGDDWEGLEPVSEGAIFKEWIDDNGWSIWEGTIYAWNFTSDQTVYAKFVPPVYVTVDLSGGNLTNGVPNGWTASDDGSYTKAYPQGQIAEFGTEWEGYEPASADAVFNKWVDSGGDDTYGSIYYIEEDTTVYAKFSPFLNVIVDLKGGAISAESVPAGWTVVTGEPDKYIKRYPAEMSDYYNIRTEWDNVIPTYPEASGVGFLEWEAVDNWYYLEDDNSVIRAKTGELKTVTLDFDGGTVLSSDSSWALVSGSTDRYTKKYPEGYGVYLIEDEIKSAFSVEEYSNGKFFKNSFTYNKYNVDGDDTTLTAQYIDGITVNIGISENGYIWYDGEPKDNTCQIIIPEDSNIQPENGMLSIGNYSIARKILEVYGNPGYELDYYTLNGNPISSYVSSIASGDSISAVFKTGTQKYPVWVGGVQLSDENTSVLGGTVSYDPTAKVLTLDGANIVSPTATAINFASDLTIDVKSDSTLTLDNLDREHRCLIAGVPDGSTSYSNSTANLNIIGDGKLTVNLEEPVGMQPRVYGICSKNLMINADVDIICDKLWMAQGTAIGYFSAILAPTTTINNARVSINLTSTDCVETSGIYAYLVDGDLILNHANLSMYMCKEGTGSYDWNLAFVSGNLTFNSGCISADAEDASLAITLSKRANIINISGANDNALPTDLIFYQKNTSAPLVLLTEKPVTVSGVCMTKTDYVIGEIVECIGSPVATDENDTNVTASIDSWTYTYFRQNNGRWDSIGTQAPTERGNYKLVVEANDNEYHGILNLPFIITTKHTITFDANGHGTAPAAKTNILYGSKIDAPTAPSCDGYTFGGWYKEASCNSEWVFDTDIVTADATLYAKWTENTPEPTPTPTPTPDPEPGKSDNLVKFKLPTVKSSGSKSIKLSWQAVPGATKYVVYGNRCGKDSKKIKTTKKTSYTIKKMNGKKLTNHRHYKVYIVAYTPDGKVKGRAIHTILGNTQGKYANVKSIKAKYKGLTLGVGNSKKIGATYKMYAGKKHIKSTHGKALRYISDNPEVAKVSKTGKITAVSVGTATIYIQDIGGKYCKTLVTVE